MIIDASHDGSGRAVGFAGGPSFGDLVDGLNPAPATQVFGGAFYDELDLLLEGVTGFDCSLEPTESAPAADHPMSEVALYCLDEAGRMIPAADPLGADALAALDITGSPGGELSIFYPLNFIAPDTLYLDLDAPALGIQGPARRDRLRLSAIAPNPTTRNVEVTFDLPAPGPVAVRVFDVQGRLVAEPLKGMRRAGKNSVAWDARGRSRRKVAAGLYIVQVQFGGQSVVRKFIVLR